MTPVSRPIKIACICNLLGTTLFGASIYTNHPLFFMAVVSLGMVLLPVGLIIWARTVIKEAHGKGIFH